MKRTLILAVAALPLLFFSYDDFSDEGDRAVGGSVTVPLIGNGTNKVHPTLLGHADDQMTENPQTSTTINIPSDGTTENVLRKEFLKDETWYAYQPPPDCG